jgi:hypothetical protein
MKLTALILLTFSASIALAQQTETVMVNGNKFIIKKYLKKGVSSGSKVVNAFDIDSIELYRNNKRLLSHVMADDANDCNSSSLELGNYDVTDSSIVFYSFYTWTGKCVGCNYGAKKQVYKVTAAGKLLLEKSVMTMATTVAVGNTNKVKNVLDKQSAELEEYHHAKLVFGDEAKSVITGVKAKVRTSLTYFNSQGPYFEKK